MNKEFENRTPASQTGELRAGMTPEAHTRMRKTIDVLCECSDSWRSRAQKAERALRELEQDYLSTDEGSARQEFEKWAHGKLILTNVWTAWLAAWTLRGERDARIMEKLETNLDLMMKFVKALTVRKKAWQDQPQIPNQGAE
jgi:hypothetical protein